LPGVHLGLATDEAPHELTEAPGLEHGLGVGDRRLDLEPVADDARVTHEPVDVARPELRHLLRVEAGERAAGAVAFVQDRRPREACLGALEDEHLEEVPLVARRYAPFLVVVGDVERVALRNPGAPGHAGAACGPAVAIMWAVQRAAFAAIVAVGGCGPDVTKTLPSTRKRVGGSGGGPEGSTQGVGR